jgi:ubiquinone biosynthesis protein COQ9
MVELEASALRNRWLDAVLCAPQQDWSRSTLESARCTAVLTVGQARAAAPRGAIDLVEAWFERGDAAMLSLLATSPATKIRVRATLAVRTSIEALAVHRPLLTSALRMLALPKNVASGIGLNWRFADVTWLAIEGKTTGFSFFSKRVILASVKASTLAFWFCDESENAEQTWNFLDRRIEDVMRIGRFKARIRWPRTGSATR